MWIQNVSMRDIKCGDYHGHGVGTMLIQITDPAYEPPQPHDPFELVYQFEFLDLERDDYTEEEGFKCQPHQAKQLVQLLQYALDNELNVVVHCHAGVCRSGAVCEVGVMMGFEDLYYFRSPNLLVKHLMMQELGWTYDESEPHTINGEPVDFSEDGKLRTLARMRNE